MSHTSHEEAVQLLQDGKIGYLQFVMHHSPVERANEFLEWCNSHDVLPGDEAAEFFVHMTFAECLDAQDLPVDISI